MRDVASGIELVALPTFRPTGIAVVNDATFIVTGRQQSNPSFGGVYLATPGGHGYVGIPLPAAISVVGRATDPRGVVVYTTSLTADPQDTAFHLLVLCPDGYA